MVKIFLIAGALLISLLITPQKVYATDCDISITPKQALESSSAVFSGKVLKIENKNDHKSIIFQVNRWWKGYPEELIWLTTAVPPATWGYPLKEGKEYLVYTTNNERVYEVNICSRTKELSKASEDLKELGEGRLPKSKMYFEPLFFFAILLAGFIATIIAIIK